MGVGEGVKGRRRGSRKVESSYGHMEKGVRGWEERGSKRARVREV